MNKTIDGEGPLFGEILATIPQDVIRSTQEIYARHAQVVSVLMERAGIRAINTQLSDTQQGELEKLLVASGFQGKTLGVMSTTLRRVVPGFNFKDWPKLADAVKVEVKPLDPLSLETVRRLRQESRERSVLAGAVVNTLLDTGALPEELVRVNRMGVGGFEDGEPKIKVPNVKSRGYRILPLSLETGELVDMLIEASRSLDFGEGSIPLFPTYDNGRLRADRLGRQAPWYMLKQIDTEATTRRIRETVVMEHTGTSAELGAKFGITKQRADVYLMRRELVFAQSSKD